jgi:ABC-2 type transport system permease protein
MIKREFMRVKMEPSRIAGMLLQPLLFLLVFGAGFHRSFRLADDADISYASFFYPGILGLVLLFSSIYATLTLVDDKKNGFFRLVLISPIGVGGALSGKVLATAALGFLQSLLFLPLLFFLPLRLYAAGFAAILVFLALGSFCFALMGVALAWLSPSPSAFHALMSIILIPMWLLSGAMFPVERSVFYYPSFLNPMSYLVGGLRAVFLQQALGLSFMLVLVCCCLMLIALLRLIVQKRPL